MILPPTAQPKGLSGSGTRTRGVYGAFIRGYDQIHSGIYANKLISLFESRIRARGVNGAYVRGYELQRSGLNHSAIPLPNIGLRLP